MVIANDFEFTLVSATDKIPFPEHRTRSKSKNKNTRCYVEAEPDAEYFLSTRKVRDSQTNLLCRYVVDGKDLGIVEEYNAEGESDASYSGLTPTSAGGVSVHRALRFVQAPSAVVATAAAAGGTTGTACVAVAVGGAAGKTATPPPGGVFVGLGLGKIDLEVYEAIGDDDAAEEGAARRDKNNASSEEGASGETTRDDGGGGGDSSSGKTHGASGTAGTTAAAAATTAKKSNLRSREGHHIESLVLADQKFDRGVHLYTITLLYCAAPVLIALGVVVPPATKTVPSIKAEQQPATNHKHRKPGNPKLFRKHASSTSTSVKLEHGGKHNDTYNNRIKVKDDPNHGARTVTPKADPTRVVSVKAESKSPTTIDLLNDSDTEENRPVKQEQQAPANKSTSRKPRTRRIINLFGDSDKEMAASSSSVKKDPNPSGSSLPNKHSKKRTPGPSRKAKTRRIISLLSDSDMDMACASSVNNKKDPEPSGSSPSNQQRKNRNFPGSASNSTLNGGKRKQTVALL
mmetsp:Transcript_20225/g.42013  ORF Transcript_20225/g.42013 Transcript_20225/m.42013 type:complete len:516 (-) Transcript_20225:321-1868(-)|eukprot:CAMPEP_0201120264 /NCGR_PEP_ID=MMETSP0850-20130426/4344_1 /ASSEMBLY_ACC=CAM_ASM_000622 /TAXON_ID=183588 /ORGANISM="Pseudo-nitzschia fraudulenta, Strain WWA7" /LENGTH=515 /DNA_ID=CAMNT_0047386339 /DNA_START=104 /DNA_END=1651 /DNA_ORIENTATION=+